MRFKNYIENEKDIKSLIELAMFMEEDVSMINEAEGGIAGKLNSLLGKIGFHASPSDTGIIQVLLKGGKNIAQLLWYAMKATTGDQKAKEKVKEIANTEITKEQVLDFLLKLDMLTLHAVTGPIHMIDALTGWHLGPTLKKAAGAAKSIEQRIKTAISNMIDVADEVPDRAGKILSTYATRLKQLFGVV